MVSMDECEHEWRRTVTYWCYDGRGDVVVEQCASCKRERTRREKSAR